MIPNRSKEVKAIVSRYPQAFGPPGNTVDARRRLLIPIIVKELNKLDGDRWFLLNRLDRQDDDPKPGRLTSDVIVWGPTKEHVDVLSSSGAMWNEHPPITDKDWKLEHPSNWPSWDDVNGPVVPPVDPVKPPPVVPPPAPVKRADYGTYLSTAKQLADALTAHRGGYSGTDIAHFLYGIFEEGKTLANKLAEIRG